MNVQISNNKITIFNPDSFNIKHILECGQVFRFKNLGDSYQVISLNHKAQIYTYQDKVEIVTDSPQYFYEYFGLNTDYVDIKNKLSKFDELTCAIKYGSGIRILKQDLFETIISFIISANNNIKRIQGIIERICETFGAKLGDYYAFPTIDSLAKADENFYKSIGAGYRSSYLVKAVKQLLEWDFKEDFSKIPTCVLHKKLTSICGVGPKVADCILLFGVGKKDVFPVDTWIQKVYNDQYNDKKSREKIAQIFVSKYGELSGYAQQYFFYNKRENG